MDWDHPLVIIITQNLVSRLLGTGAGRDREELLRRVDQLHERVHALQTALVANGKASTAPATAPAQVPTPTPNSSTAPSSSRLPEQVATSCLACARAHLRAVQVALEKAAQADGQPAVRSPQAQALRDRLVDLSARLKEAVRFAREDGMQHPEVTRRLERLADEVVVLERFDAAPEVVASLPPDERQVVERVMPGLRRLRQRLSEGVRTPEDLILAAADAGRIGRELYGNPYLHFADEELSALLAYDLSPDNLRRSRPDERAAVEPIVEEIQRIRAQVRQLSDGRQAPELARQVEAIRTRLGPSGA